MIPLSCIRLFLGGFSVRVVGQEFRVGLWVSERFRQQLGGVSFSGAPLLWGGVRLFLYDFRGCGFWFWGDDDRRGGNDGNGSSGSNGGLVGLGRQ
jgi:hypothetical protein